MAEHDDPFGSPIWLKKQHVIGATAIISGFNFQPVRGFAARDNGPCARHVLVGCTETDSGVPPN